MRLLEKVRPVWAEVNLDNLAHNIKEVKRVINKETLIMAVVKADGYGHGSVKAAEVFLKNGADRLAVATLSEAIELRSKGIKVPILILGYTPETQMEEITRNDITQTVYNYEQAQAISSYAKKYKKVGKIHIKIDTGMGRLGFKPDEVSIEEIFRILKLDNIEVEGIFTHFAVADEKDKSYTREQYSKFQWTVKSLKDKGVDIPIRHVSNSAAVIDLSEYNLDMVRPGIMLYGLYPSDDINKKKVELRPAMTLKARISHIKTVEKGTGISYGQIYITKRKSKIGTLPLGYADGFTRMLTNKGEVSVNGIKAPVIGRVCMDQCMIDLTEVENVKVGDEVVIFGDGKNNTPHIDEVAKKLGTINYEIVCMVSRRVPRVYIKEGQIVDIRDYILS